MKRYSIVGVLIALLSCFSPSALAGDPNAQTALVSYYSNNGGKNSPLDQFIRLINNGNLGTPLTSPIGDVCANTYVFDANQAMVACCSCRVTPNGVASFAVGRDLTSNTLTSLAPMNGTVFILPIPAALTTCSPFAPLATSDASLLTGYGSHLTVEVGPQPGTAVTETELAAVRLTSDQAIFLNDACVFVQYLGSGQGTCKCSNPQ
jgi:hypothetical protein